MSPLKSLVGRRLLFKSNDGGEFSAAAQEAGTLSLDLLPRNTNGRNVSAHVLRHSPPSAALDLKQKGGAQAVDYFEPITAEGGKLKIEVDRFHIFRSVERLVLPEDIAVTGMAYSENLGELRIHYAGFAHPWFGMHREDGKTGTPLIFEVRAHSFPILLRHEEVFASIRFYKMSIPIPEKERKSEKNSYSEQELKLSNYFRDS